jgi:2-amino-4-hydroxy-6-hydroxymethyldihydropteridine diphosphokinase
MRHCYLALGSNLENPQRQLYWAVHRLRNLPAIQVKKIAAFYKNPAWGRKVQPYFYNTVIEIYTRLSPSDLLKICLNLEQQRGRKRRAKWAARSLDIDILLYDNLRISTKDLVIPHPFMEKRDFVLIPLNELGHSSEKRKEKLNRSG